eukprot:14655395-Alexandrium_andersonii.AAC.1
MTWERPAALIAHRPQRHAERGAAQRTTNAPDYWAEGGLANTRPRLAHLASIFCEDLSIG